MGWRKKGALLLLCGLLWLRPSEELAAEADVSVEMEEPLYIALTFDDGPRRATTTRLLDGLKERGASATFFLVGEQIAGQEDLVRRMREEGHQVGNHTWSHTLLEGAESAVIRREIDSTDRLLRQLLGEGDYWVRPPYGLIAEKDKPFVKVPMVHWSIDPRDWEVRKKEPVLQNVLQEAGPGAIILLHDIYDTSVDAALEIVDALSARGYWFVTVTELLQLRGIRAEAGTLYLHA